MDYEKKYNEALERARELRDKALAYNANHYVKDYETIFPELRESDGEKIRKGLLTAFQKMNGWWNGMLVSGILSWLEKQKEPHYTKRNALFDKCVENCDPAIMKEVSDKVDEMLRKEQKSSVWESPIMTHEMIMEKQKEQKPVEWSDEDEEHLKWLCRIVHSRKVHGELSLEEESELGQWIDRWINHNPQPKWDEFDENCLKRAIWYVENPAPSVVKDSRLAIWLNMLRSRFFLKPQPKAEWSEEDEEIFNNIIEKAKGGHWIEVNEITWLINRFKSLRPQPQGTYKLIVHNIYEMLKDKDFFDIPPSHRVSLLNDIRVRCKNADEQAEILDIPSWKPTEEQMNALNFAITYFMHETNYKNPTELRDLYDDLLKLK